MKLYTAKIPVIAQEIIRELVAGGDIEVDNQEEAQLDVEAVLKEYSRLDREVTEQTKDALERRNLTHGQFGKVKRNIAEEKGLGMGDEALTWICNQTIESFMHSNYIAEIFSSDIDLRRKMKLILRRHMLMDEELDQEVRNRIKNLQEGTANWDVEYSRVLDQIKRKHGLKE